MSNQRNGQTALILFFFPAIKIRAWVRVQEVCIKASSAWGSQVGCSRERLVASGRCRYERFHCTLYCCHKACTGFCVDNADLPSSG